MVPDKTIDKILESLNEEQKAAVLTLDGPVLIVAGAGSGKTRVLTSRIALLLENGVHPSEILALTFTKKAAEEMRSRIRKMAGPQAAQLVMGTFHSVFVRFLREWYSYIGFPQSFTIYDAEDAQSCLRTCIGEVLFGPDWNDKETNKALDDNEKKRRKRLWEVYKVKDVASRISRLKNDFILPKDYGETPEQIVEDNKLQHPEMGNIYELYMKRCRKAGAMDFDDILVYMNWLIESNPEAAKSIARRFRYILVDEYQDTNAVQYNIVRKLSLAYGNICVVGDDSQSIYAFRGARVQNILNFSLDYPGLKTFRLETNYRSTPQIVDAANRLIAYNATRIPKHCHASRPSGKDIQLEYLYNDRAEAKYIASAIALNHKTGKPYSDHAILYRTNAQSRALEDALMKARIPYMVYSGTSFFERMEIKDVLAYMRLLANPSDDEAFKRVCNKPARGISEATLTWLTARAARDEKPVYEVAKSLRDDLQTDLKPKAVQAVTGFVGLIDNLIAMTARMGADDATFRILEETGIYELYKKEDDDDGTKRSNNIDALLSGVRDFVTEREMIYDEGNAEELRTSLSDYLEDIALLSSVDVSDDDGDKVALMTSHCSKGLEFPVVFIAGVEEGLYPSLRDQNSAFELEEERRLFYVSMTRAKDRLILTSCESRWKYGETIECEPSRFIDEMAPDEDDLPE